MPDEHTGLRFAWWNTRLSPPRGTPLPELEKAIVFRTVLDLLEAGVDFFALCEVSESDIDALSDATFGTPFVVTSYVGAKEVGKFGIGLIWNSDRVAVISHEYIVDVVRGYGKRIGLRLNIQHKTGFNFDTFLVHWPSRLHMDEESASRELLGDRLRQSIDQERRKGQNNFIVMGDFNDEPFNESLTEGLRSSRDPARAIKQSDIFYNPFWRHMSPINGHVWDEQHSERRGSFYHRSHQLDRWRLLDQILFSSAFVGEGDWHMREEGTHVLQNDTLVEIVESSKFGIDHMPILGEIRKRS